MFDLAVFVSNPVTWACLACLATGFAVGALTSLRSRPSGADATGAKHKERRRSVTETEKILHGVAQHANDGDRKSVV